MQSKSESVIGRRNVTKKSISVDTMHQYCILLPMLTQSEAAHSGVRSSASDGIHLLAPGRGDADGGPVPDAARGVERSALLRLLPAGGREAELQLGPSLQEHGAVESGGARGAPPAPRPGAVQAPGRQHARVGSTWRGKRIETARSTGALLATPEAGGKVDCFARLGVEGLFGIWRGSLARPTAHPGDYPSRTSGSADGCLWAGTTALVRPA